MSPPRKEEDAVSPPRKMSEILKEMSARLHRKPADEVSSEAAHVALMLATIAWNESVGVGDPGAGRHSGWKIIEAEKPDLWTELKSNDADAMIAELVRFKRENHPDDLRRILVAGGLPNGNLHVEWLNPAPPEVDPQWEVTLHGLVRTDRLKEAIQFLQDVRGMSRKDAARKVAAVVAGQADVASSLGIELSPETEVVDDEPKKQRPQDRRKSPPRL